MTDEEDHGAQDPKAAKQAAAAEPMPAATDDVHSRVTLPAPAPERLDPTPVTLRLEARVRESAPVPVRAERVQPIAVASEELMTEPLLENEIETWRPPAPPPVPKHSQVVPAGTVSASSSIAPRDLPQREEPQPKIASLASVGLLALLGATTIWFMSGGGPEGEPSALGGPSQPVPATAPATVPAPAPAPSEVAQPVIAEATPAPANDPAMVAKAPSAPEPAPVEAPVAVAPAQPRLTPARAKSAPVAAAAPLPDQPSRQTIADTLGSMRSDLALCAGGKPGVAELDLTLTGAGVVSNAVVGGDFAGSPQGSCIARTLRRARFAPFAQAKFRVLYRLML